MRSNVLLLSLAAVVSVGIPSHTQTPVQPRAVSSGDDLAYENPEFPPYDQHIWRWQRPGRVTKAAAAALAQAPTAPETPALLAEANRLDDALDALEQLVERYPPRIARAFELFTPHISRFFSDRLHPERLDWLREVGLTARRQAATLPREEAARAVFHLLFLERNFFPRGGRTEAALQLKEFVEEYAGTDAALIAEVDMITQDTNILREIDTLKKFAADHPGTTAAAKALYQAGFQLGVNVGIGRNAPRGVDPTDRVFEVHELMKELQSGRYRNSEWMDKAPSLVLGVFASKPTYAPENIDRLLALYQTLVIQHLTRTDQAAVQSAVDALMKMARLFKLKGDETGLDKALAEMERGGHESAVRYLGAIAYMKAMNDEWREDRPALLEKARAALASVEKAGSGVYQRRALATLASLYFAERDFARARDTYRSYLGRYPASPWSWVAALRVGQSLEALGDELAAIDAYRGAAASYRANPVARAVGHAYAARALESLSRFDEALIEWRRALQAWDPDFVPAYSLSMGYPGIPADLQERELRREQLALRVAQLQESLKTANGHLLERGRWLLDHGKPTDAVVPFEQVLSSSRNSPIGLEARLLVHKARLLRALDFASGPSPDIAAALAELDLVTRDEYGAGVLAAKVARASIVWKREIGGGAAESLMHEALTEWRSRQVPPGGDVSAPIARDVADIRNLVFHPAADGIYDVWARSRQGSRRSRPFVVLNPEVLVKLSNGAETRHLVYEDPGGAEQALFLTASQLSLILEVHKRLEGELGRQTSEVIALWNRFVHVQRGFTGGLVLESYPIISNIEFLDAERKRAAARVVIGHEGCTVVLEKDHGVWKVIRLTDAWIA